MFPRRFDKDLPRAVKANGVWIEDDAGARYLDAGGGALVEAGLFHHAFRAGMARAAQRSPAHGTTAALRPQPAALTRREANVLRLVAQGMTNSEIAAALSFAEITIKHDVRHVIAKLGAANRTHAATIALRQGLLD